VIVPGTRDTASSSQRTGLDRRPSPRKPGESDVAFTFRGFELHGGRMWQRAHILQALDFIEAHRMTALVLHEPDIIHHLVFPRTYFNPYAQWKSAPARRGENALQNNRIYFDHVLHLAKNRGVEIWLEVKELAFPDEVLEMNPGLLKNGVVCPSEPFWAEFIEKKTEELVHDFPLLNGIILSPGSPEGRASRAQNKCRCTVCESTTLPDWYDRIIRAMHAPLRRTGKRLAVRDFAYKPADHAPLIEAVSRQPDDVIFCIKVTPHDFYPTFPDNPAIGRLPREQWVEYDTQGQFFGWGVFPCVMFDDIRQRLDHASRHGVTGGLFRSEWERVNDWWVLESLNVLNMVTAATLARDPSTTDEAIVTAWLRAQGLPTNAAGWLQSMLRETWPILRGALFVGDFVFADCSMFPRSLGRAWWTMEVKHSLEAWAPAYRGRLDLDGERIELLMQEKRRAHASATALVARLQADTDAPAPLRARLQDCTALLPRYTQGMMLCAEVCLRARWHDRDPATSDTSAFRAALARLEQFGKDLEPYVEAARYPHQTLMLLDYRRVADIVTEAHAALEARH
jgi:hypothetical protein